MPTTPSAAFLAFWDAYRCKRRVKRLEAWTQWQAQGCEGESAEVMAGLARFKLTDQWREGFMPEPGRWLRHQRWTDDPVEDDVRMTGGDSDGWQVGPPNNSKGE